MNWRARSSGGIAAAIVIVVALGACSDTDVDEPGGSPPTLYEPTLLIDPTPTTQP
jgi:hypothetical protein